MSSAFAFLHHAVAFTLFGALFAELVLLRNELTNQTARSLLRIDAVYGVSAAALVVFGLVRVYFTEKGAAYYLHSSTFIAKIVLFALVGLLSIYPTREFMSWRKALRAQSLPVLDEARRASLRRVVHNELALLLLVILCAVLMARGIGYFG